MHVLSPHIGAVETVQSSDEVQVMTPVFVTASTLPVWGTLKDITVGSEGWSSRKRECRCNFHQTLETHAWCQCPRHVFDGRHSSWMACSAAGDSDFCKVFRKAMLATLPGVWHLRTMF